MSIALPNLDDRRWVDLVEEGRSLIPFYSTEWTDHNVHDPGITLIELFAWLAEMDIFQLDRIPERNLRAFLSLIGVRPNPPAPALAVTRLAFKHALMTTPPVRIPPSVELEGVDAFGVTTRFRTLSELFVTTAALQAIQVKDLEGSGCWCGRNGHRSNVSKGASLCTVGLGSPHVTRRLAATARR
jgi:predicted phage baseplate assembly protein